MERCGAACPSETKRGKQPKSAGFIGQMVTKKRLSNRRHLDCARITGKPETMFLLRLSKTLRGDLCRVNFEVNKIKPFPHLAFPHFETPENTSKHLGFDGELMVSFFQCCRDASPDCWCN